MFSRMYKLCAVAHNTTSALYFKGYSSNYVSYSPSYHSKFAFIFKTHMNFCQNQMRFVLMHQASRLELQFMFSKQCLYVIKSPISIWSSYNVMESLQKIWTRLLYSNGLVLLSLSELSDRNLSDFICVFEVDWKAYRFGTTWGWVNDDNFWVNNPLTFLKVQYNTVVILLFCFVYGAYFLGVNILNQHSLSID